MRFVDICVDQFGVLNDTQLRDLSPGMTVVYGGNGSGKTTIVNFLRGLLYGYTKDHEDFQPNDHSFGGSVSLQSHGRACRLARERRHGISSDLSVMDPGTGVTLPAKNVALPEWINETVYREVFSVGYQEASRFDLLTRLCLADDGTTGTDGEIRQSELAIEQSVREREGNGMEGGLRQNLSRLRQRREALSRELAELRKTSPAVPTRIAEVEAEIRRRQAALASVEQQSVNVQAEIRRLTELLEALRRRYVVNLDRREIEDRISQLGQRQYRWEKIRQAIQEQLSTLSTPTSERLQSGDSLLSIRALVSRLEQRIDALETDKSGFSTQLAGVDRRIFVDHLRSEVFSLCDYVKRHESAIAAHEVSLETMLGQRTLHDADNVDAVLQGRIDALKEELLHSEDVLSTSHQSATECSSHSHAAYRHTTENSPTVRGTVEDTETELGMQRHRLDELHSERRSISEAVQRLDNELTELRGRLKPVAGLADIDRLKTAIAAVDAQLELLQSRWDVLERTETHLRTVIQRLKEYRNPRILEQASQYIARLTEGDCYRLSANSAGTAILATSRQSAQPQSLQQLSRGTQDQVALALRLALIQHRADEAERCPLVLDDVFITADDDRAAAAADLLMEVAADGQQIIFFTCQNDVRDLFQRRHAGIRLLEEPLTVPTPLPMETPLPTLSIPAPPTPPTPPTPPPTPAPAPTPVGISENTNWLFYLEVDNTVEDLSGLTVAEVEAFRASDIDKVDDLLTASVDDLESRFQQHGYSISRDRIRAWRGQAELATQVPMLRRSDAELLYAAGIQSTVELSRMRPESVYDTVAAFQNSQQGSRYRRSGRVIDRQQAINWSRWSQHARSLNEARRSRSRYFVRTSDQHNSPADAARRPRTGSPGISYRRAGMSRTGTSRRRQPRPRLTTDAQRLREERQSRRRERVSRHSASYRTSSGSDDEATSAGRTLRFYLNRSDDVEAAPSIGPRTAQRLGTVGIFTVDDLLNANADDIASRLDNRRINADTIQQWQAQASLVCQVPELRGHDSQILVACGITEAEQLAGKRPVDLMMLVGPFVDTSEGERIVRGGRKPDLEEVTDWVRWAQSSRSLKSAA